MRKLGFAVSLVLAMAILGSTASSQQDKPVLTMEKMMTPDEMRETGVATLTAPQRAALDKWLNRYTDFVLQQASGLSSTGGKTYAGVGGGHWIRKISGGGKVITLEDGSLWEISAVDRANASHWRPITSIKVVESRSLIGEEYKYLLINTDGSEKILAKYLGQE